MDMKCDFPIRENFSTDSSGLLTAPLDDEYSPNLEEKPLSGLPVQQHNSELDFMPDADIIDSCVDDNTYPLEDAAVCAHNESSSKCDSDSADDLTEQLDQTNNNSHIDDHDDLPIQQSAPAPDTSAQVVAEPELRNPASQSRMTDSLQSESDDKVDLEDGIFYDCAEFDKSPPQSLVSVPEPPNRAASSGSSSDNDDQIDLAGLDAMDFSSSDWLYAAASDASSAGQFQLEEAFSFPQMQLSVAANKASPQSLLASLGSPAHLDEGPPDTEHDSVADGNRQPLPHAFGRSIPSAAAPCWPDRSMSQQKSPQKVSRFLPSSAVAAGIGMARAASGAASSRPDSVVAPPLSAGDALGTVGAARHASRDSPDAPRALPNSLIARGVARPTAGVLPAQPAQSGAVIPGAPAQSSTEADTPRTALVAPHSALGVSLAAPHKAAPFGAGTVGAPGRPRASVLSGEGANSAGGSSGVPRITQIVRLGGPADVSPHAPAPHKLLFGRPRPPAEKLVEPSRLPGDTRQIRPPGTVVKAASAVPKSVAKQIVAPQPLSADQIDSSRIRLNLLRPDQARRHTIIDVVPLATGGTTVAVAESGSLSTPGSRRRIARPTSLVKPVSSSLCSNNNVSTTGGHDNSAKCCLSPSDVARPALASHSSTRKPSVGPPIPSDNVPTMTTSVAMTPSATAAVATGPHDSSNASWSSTQQQLQPLNRTFDRDQFRVLKSFTNTVANDNPPSQSGSDASTDTLRSSSSDSENNNSHPLLLTALKSVPSALVHGNSAGLQRKLALLPNPCQNEPGIYQLARREEENLKKHVRSSLVSRQLPASQQSALSRLPVTRTSPVRPRGIPTLRK